MKEKDRQLAYKRVRACAGGPPRHGPPGPTKHAQVGAPCDDCARVVHGPGKDPAKLLTSSERRCKGCGKPVRGERVYFGNVGPFCCTKCRDRHYALLGNDTATSAVIVLEPIGASMMDTLGQRRSIQLVEERPDAWLGYHMTWTADERAARGYSVFPKYAWRKVGEP